MTGNTAILTLYAAWKDARRVCNSLDPDGAQYAAAFARLQRLEARIIELPASGPADFAAKVLVAEDDGDLSGASHVARDLVQHAKALLGKLA